MKYFKKKKKGSIGDLLWIGVILLVISVTILICYKVYDAIDTKFQESSQLPATSKAASSQIKGHFSGVLDNSFLFLTIMLALMAFVLAALVRVHPIFFVFYILMLALVIFLAGVFSNIYQEMAGQPEMTALADDLTFISLIMTYLPFLVGVFGSILSIVMYKIYSMEQI